MSSPTHIFRPLLSSSTIPSPTRHHHHPHTQTHLRTVKKQNNNNTRRGVCGIRRAGLERHCSQPPVYISRQNQKASGYTGQKTSGYTGQNVRLLRGKSNRLHRAKKGQATPGKKRLAIPAGMKTSPPFSAVPPSSSKISSVGKNSPPKKGRG